MGPYDDLNIVIEGDEKSQKSFDGELPIFPPQHLGNIGLFDPEKIGGFGLFQATVVHNGVKLIHQLCLDQVLLGM
jgi:hypothetical protein